MSKHNDKLLAMLKAKFRGEKGWTEDEWLAAYACWRVTSRQDWQQFPHYFSPANRKIAWKERPFNGF